MIDREEFTETQENLYQTLLFLSKLMLAGGVFHLILWIYPDTRLFQSLLADITASMLNSSGIKTVTEGFSIIISGTTYVITQDCLGWKSIAAFTGLIFASTERTLEHLNFLIQGFTALIIANIIRIYTTVLLAEKGVISFEVVHRVLWRWSLTLLILLMWIYWYRNLKDREPVYQQRIKEHVKEIKEK
ncbi:MAG: exosortase/archaeosortase family protein [Candidatus Nanohalobium sp.]